MKIYTKKGDKGKTQLLGGTEIDKDHIRLHCYGSIDELNAFIGHIYDQDINISHKKTLLNIQNKLFNLGSLISFDGEKTKIKLPNINTKDITYIEECIDKIEEALPSLTNFILPSGHKIASLCHIARTVCRRTERHMVNLYKVQQIDQLHLQYMNRLSDYLFVLARIIIIEHNGKEMIWEKDC